MTKFGSYVKRTTFFEITEVIFGFDEEGGNDII